MFVLPPARIEVKSSGIRYVAPGIIRYDRDVITYLVLIRPAFGGIKRLTDRHVGRPGRAAVCAIGIEQLREEAAGVVAGVVPDGVKPPVWRY